MGFFSKQKEENVLLASFNVGSSHVTGALFVAGSSGVPEIIFSTISPIKIEEEINPDKFLAVVIKALDKVSSNVFKAGLGTPKKIFCTLSSPWYFSQTRTISYKSAETFIFSEKLADDLIKKEIEIFNKEHLKYSTGQDNIRPIELKSIKTLLNGYETANPLGQKATELEMTVFISISSEKVLGLIETTLEKYFNFKNIKFSSFAMSSFTVVRDMFTQKENFLLIDIAGEVTEIFLTKRNILQESISYPLGKNFLIRGVAKNTGCTIDESTSLLSLVGSGHAEQSVEKKVIQAMKGLKADWLKSFQESLAHLSKDISIPSNIYIIVDPKMVEFFEEIIKTEQFSQYTLAESKFEVIFLSMEMFQDKAVLREDIAKDNLIIIDAIYINRFLKSFYA